MKNEIVLYEIEKSPDNIKLIPEARYSVSNNKYDDKNTILLLNQFFNLGYLEKEYVYIVSINQDDVINGLMLAAKGDKNHADIETEPIILFLVLNQAKRFSIYHNHPNGELRASEDDYECAEIMNNIVKDLRIEFIGSFILFRDNYIKVD